MLELLDPNPELPDQTPTDQVRFLTRIRNLVLATGPKRGLFRLWVLVTTLWLLGCVWFGATHWHWFQPGQVYEVADTNDEKYRVEASPDTPEDEVALFVQKSAGSKWLRKECAKDRRGAWCDVVTSLQMPRQYFTWQYLAVSIGGPLSLLMIGAALYWAFSGFRRERTERG